MRRGTFRGTMPHVYYSQRTGSNPEPEGLDLHDIKTLFVHLYDNLNDAGHFAQSFGSFCVDGPTPGVVRDVNLEILLRVRKRNLWPLSERSFTTRTIYSTSLNSFTSTSPSHLKVAFTITAVAECTGTPSTRLRGKKSSFRR